MRLPQAIRGLFKREDDSALVLKRPATAADTDQPRARARPKRSDRARLKHFERRLRLLTHSSSRSGPLVAGRLQIIALSRVKERFGEDWPRLATKVYRLTQQILELRLTEADVYVRMDDRYMILFAQLTSVEATFKAQAIAREIAALLIGELPEVDEAPVRVTVHEIDPGELRARPTLKTLVARMDDLAARAAGTSDGGGPGGARFARRDPVQFDYLPIWSRRGRAIVGYLCTCRQGTHGGDQDDYDLDCLALRTVLATLPDMERNGHAALVVAPIRWDTLVQFQRRQAYLDLCRHLPCQLNRHLGFSILDVAPGAWCDLIRDRLFLLKPYARFLFVCVPPDPAQIRHLADIGVDALAFDVTQASPFDSAQRQRIEDFVRDASRHKLATCAFGVSERNIALALLTAGVDFLGGDAVAPKVGAPGAAYRIDLNA